MSEGKLQEDGSACGQTKDMILDSSDSELVWLPSRSIEVIRNMVEFLPHHLRLRRNLHHLFIQPSLIIVFSSGRNTISLLGQMRYVGVPYKNNLRCHISIPRWIQTTQLGRGQPLYQIDWALRDRASGNIESRELP